MSKIITATSVKLKEELDWLEQNGTPEQKESVLDYMRFLYFKREWPEIKKTIRFLNYRLDMIEYGQYKIDRPL